MKNSIAIAAGLLSYAVTACIIHTIVLHKMQKDIAEVESNLMAINSNKTNTIWSDSVYIYYYPTNFTTKVVIKTYSK